MGKKKNNTIYLTTFIFIAYNVSLNPMATILPPSSISYSLAIKFIVSSINLFSFSPPLPLGGGGGGGGYNQYQQNQNQINLKLKIMKLRT